MSCTFYTFDRGGDSYDIVVALDDDSPVTDVPPGGPLGKHGVSSRVGLEHFMCTTLRFSMTPDQVREFANGKSYRNEITAASYRDYFQG